MYFFFFFFFFYPRLRLNFSDRATSSTSTWWRQAAALARVLLAQPVHLHVRPAVATVTAGAAPQLPPSPPSPPAPPCSPAAPCKTSQGVETCKVDCYDAFDECKKGGSKNKPCRKKEKTCKKQCKKKFPSPQ